MYKYIYVCTQGRRELDTHTERERERERERESKDDASMGSLDQLSIQLSYVNIFFHFSGGGQKEYGESALKATDLYMYLLLQRRQRVQLNVAELTLLCNP